MFERFTDRARRVVVLAQEEARELDHTWIGTEHLLLGLVAEGQGVAARTLGLQLVQVRAEVEQLVGRGEAAPSAHLPFTPRAKKALELALRESLELGHTYLGTEHLLLGLLREGEGRGAQLLARAGFDPTRLRERVVAELDERPLARRFVPPSGTLRMESPGPDALLNLLGDDVLRALLAARAEARRLGAGRVDAEHLLAGLLAVDDDPAAALLREAGVSPDRLRQALSATASPSGDPRGPIPALAPETLPVLARGAGTTRALLDALLTTAPAAGVAVTAAGGDLDALRARLAQGRDAA
jgi:ATP-dependent Clp protease ATP-binding subunit ClpA